MATSNEAVIIFKARNNLLKQFKLQGYNVEDYEGSNLSEVSSMYEAKQMDMLITNSESGKKTYIKYYLMKNLRITNIQEYIDDLFNLENILSPLDDLVIIVKNEPNESLIKAVQNIWEQQKIFVILYNIKRLQFNILDHSLVPPHRVLTKEESDTIKKKYSITTKDQLPTISRFSPVSLAIGIRPGDICEIIRPSKTSIETLFYRICE
jgi:DNA-directed RNA polymerase subunit H (RpoH/RPB5)